MKRSTIIGLSLLITALWLAIGLLPGAFLGKPNDAAAFGDMFGTVNSLFSGLALAGVICAILLQREELSLQRKELALTRVELARSAEAQAASAQTLLQQYIVAERNTRLQAYTALLQSCNEKIAAERVRLDNMDSRFRRLMPSKINSLNSELESLEVEVRKLIESNKGA